jgi:hypothetical protein
MSPASQEKTRQEILREARESAADAAQEVTRISREMRALILRLTSLQRRIDELTDKVKQ